MRIRNRILIYFVTAVTLLAAVSLTVVLVLFSEYREEEFQQRQKAKIVLTINLLSRYKQLSENLAQTMDALTIHNIYDEKMMVFDGNKNLIFSSIDDLSIQNYDSILNELSPESIWIETKQQDYDLIGMYYEHEGRSFYAVSKALDEYGISKLEFLRNTLAAIFVGILLTVVVLSFFLAQKLAKPIVTLSEDLRDFDFYSDQRQVVQPVESGLQEIDQLYDRFNGLLKRTHESMAFQKHAVQHISHELKTPISVLVSELERLKQQSVDPAQADRMGQLAVKAKSLGEIIQGLLQISKVESGQEIEQQRIRMDELLFDLIDDLTAIYPDFHFDFRLDFPSESFDESRITVKGSSILLKQAFQNLLANALTYSDDGMAVVTLDCQSDRELVVTIANSGETILDEEKGLLFDHFFRGKNAKGKVGFGLGLVLTKKIVHLSGGKIQYTSPGFRRNHMEVRLPLK